MSRLSRRSFTGGMLSALSANAIVGCAPGLPLPRPKTGDVVDIHSHLFNGTDLPLARYVAQVIIPKNEPELTQSRGDIDDPTLGELFLELIARGLLFGTPTANQEAESLARGLSVSMAMDRSQAQARVTDTTVRILQATEPGQPEATARNPGAARARRARATIVSAAGEDAKRLADAPLSDAQHREIASRAVFSSSLGSFLHWVSLFTRHRHSLADELSDMLRNDGREPVLLTPLMVDFSRWLGQPHSDGSSLRDQVEVFAQIARRPGPAVHGMVAFDPLRAVYHKRFGQKAEPEDPLEIVEDAIVRRGFLGVKVYPPMGFKPIGNRDDQGYPTHVEEDFGGSAGLGGELDHQLGRVFDFCVDRDAPIIAHAFYSQGAGREYARRADPHFWVQVLKVEKRKWHRLRLCLAHQGAFKTPSLGAGRATPIEKTWEWVIGRHIKSDPESRLYMDVSYFSEVLEASESDRKNLATKFKLWVDEFDRRVERVVFGTDWIMVGRDVPGRDYTRRIIDFLVGDCGLDDAQLTRVMRDNAGRYLGLRAGDESRKRLLKFYQDNVISKQLPEFP